MANVDIKLGYKDSAWFTANPTLILKQGQIVALEQTGTYKLGDGVTQLSALTFLGSSGGGSWGSITGTLSNQTDLQNALNTKEDTSNKSIDIDTDQASNTKYPSVKAIYDWAVGLFVKTPGLTNFYVPRATTNNTIGDGSIYDDGTNVGIGTIAPTATIHGKGIDATSSNYALKVDNSASSPLLYVRNDGLINIDNLTPSQIVGTDASKNLVSIAFGTTAGTVMQGFTDYTESFVYTGGSFNLSVVPTFIYSIRTTSMVLDESDINDVTIVGTTLTVINPAFQAGEKLYIKYKG